MNYENLISIVMPVFNAQAYLEEALESVRRQTWTDWELLVVDDHSTDGSAGLVSEICRKDARIQLLSQMDGVKGAANARNFGTAHACGRNRQNRAGSRSVDLSESAQPDGHFYKHGAV